MRVEQQSSKKLSASAQNSLFHKALTVAELEYHNLDYLFYHNVINSWMAQLKSIVKPKANTSHKIDCLNEFLFRRLGFYGNQADYYDVKNSFINEVIDRRTGIPITLSILYIRIGSALGLSLQGVSFPGHFLVKLADNSFVLDPYNEGAALTQDQLLIRLQNTFSTQIDRVDDFLVAATDQEILTRLLNNLRTNFLQRNNPEKALQVITKIIQLNPNRIEEYRNRGYILMNLQCYKTALDDFKHYLRHTPRASDSHKIEEVIREIKTRSYYIN